MQYIHACLVYVISALRSSSLTSLSCSTRRHRHYPRSIDVQHVSFICFTFHFSDFDLGAFFSNFRVPNSYSLCAVSSRVTSILSPDSHHAECCN
ncbi:hypothetical protein B0T19DRAFT_209813 [Cercophora scortea]|uniref:Uncharacterized protein n=1 Tax=Cercophora scortea TaxID=314031 RepID=A0AAE0IEA2_9PEZI|nr:hypothetical protein B0T19DRAFT_209813 [Cercophora scortea]